MSVIMRFQYWEFLMGGKNCSKTWFPFEISRVENKTSVAFSHKVMKLLKSFRKTPPSFESVKEAL